MTDDIVYTQIPNVIDLEHVANQFCDEHGDDASGFIPAADFERLFDHLGTIISKYASYSDDGRDADFMGSRYVDRIPWITVDAADEADPRIALQAGLEAVKSAHRPLAVSFDFCPAHLMILTPNLVYTTFGLDRLI